MGIFKNKLLWGAISMVLAILLGFVIAPLVMRNAAEATVSVVRVKDFVPAQSQITKEMLVKDEVGSYGLSPNVIKDEQEVIGKYAAVDILSDDLLLPEKLKDTLDDAHMQALSGSGDIAVSVALADLSASVSGQIRPGDIVTVYAVEQDPISMKGIVKAYPELQYLKVLHLSNANAKGIDKISEEDGSSARIPATVTLLAKDFQARRLIEIESAGSVHLTLVGSDAEAQKLYDDFEPQNPYNKLDGNAMINLAWGEYLALPGTQK